MDTIYHYTNLHALKNIIETGEIWFTRVDCLNDYSEYNYYKSIFNDARNRFIKENNIIEKFDLTLLTDNKLLDIRDSYLKKTYTFSLTNCKDSIPLWNYYSDKLGIAIGFNKDLLINEIISKLNEYYAISKGIIEYNREKQYNSILNRFNEIFKIANSPEYLKNDIQETLKAVNNVYGKMWDESHMVKDSSFEYENEYRITLCKLDGKKSNADIDKVHTIVTGTDIKPVLKIRVVENWNNIINNIMISPFNRSEIVADNIYDFLQRNGINISRHLIEKSACPIR